MQKAVTTDENSIIPPLRSEEEMDAMYSSDESDDDPISMDMLEEIWDKSWSHPNVNRREKHYKICDRIKQRQYKWKGMLKVTKNMGKGLHKVFKTVVK